MLSAMLYSIDNPNRAITNIPHRKEFEAWRAGISDAQYEAIMTDLDARVEGGEVHTSSWLPPKGGWEGSVFQPIYDSACRHDYDASGLFFGLLVWKMFMDRPDDWSFGHYEKDGVPIRGLTYFRIIRR